MPQIPLKSKRRKSTYSNITLTLPTLPHSLCPGTFAFNSQNYNPPLWKNPVSAPGRPCLPKYWKNIYIPDCKISLASFVLHFHLLLLRSFFRIRSFFFVSCSIKKLNWLKNLLSKAIRKTRARHAKLKKLKTSRWKVSIIESRNSFSINLYISVKQEPLLKKVSEI